MVEKNLAEVFKALGDEHRIQILCLLHDGEKCACQLLEALNISQPTLSHHMKVLCEAGLVTGRKEGKWTHYCVCCDGVFRLRDDLRELFAARNISIEALCSETQKNSAMQENLDS